MAPVLFLDLDGVVCCNFHGELERDKLLQVKRICDEAHAEVVLSTDWRRRADLKQRALQTLSAVGVKVIGATPEYSLMSRVRPREILAWMKEHDFDQREGWCAVDDRDLVLEDGGQPAFTNHFVLTEFMSGLTPALADLCIRRLRPDSVSAQVASPPQARQTPDMQQSHLVPRPAPSPAATPLPAARASSHSASTAVSAARLAVDGTRNHMTLLDLLRESGLEHLHPAMQSVSLRSIHDYLHGAPHDGGNSGRVALLAYLRSVGVSKVGERQAVANAFSRAQRLGRIATPPSPDGEPGTSGHGPPQPCAPAPVSVLAAMPLESTLPEGVESECCSSTEAAHPESKGHLRGFAYGSIDGTSITSETQIPANSGLTALPPQTPKDEQSVRICPPHSELSVASGLLALQPGATRAAIVLHPHPGRGGDMYNPFVVQTVKLAKRSSITTLRFNFSTPEGMGDDTEALLSANCRELEAAIAMVRMRAPDVSLALIGYSWGALVGLAAARKEPTHVQALALVAPPFDVVPESLGLGRRDFTHWPVLLVFGDKDEYCSTTAVTKVTGDSACTTVLLKGVGHFLQGETAVLASRHAVDWLAQLRLEP